MEIKTTTNILLFVQVLSAMAPLTITSQTPGTMSKMWFNMESAQGAFSQTLLAYSSYTTNGIDFGYDGTLLNDGVIALYTKVDNTKLMIQARGEFSIADTVPLHYRANVAGNYTMKLHNKTGIFANGQNVYLLDNQTGNVHNFADGVYPFTATLGTTEGRFAIVYTVIDTHLGVADALSFTKNMLVYSNHNTVVVTVLGNTITELSIYDVYGKLLYNEKNAGSKSLLVAIEPRKQLLIVQINTADGGKACKRVIH